MGLVEGLEGVFQGVFEIGEEAGAEDAVNEAVVAGEGQAEGGMGMGGVAFVKEVLSQHPAYGEDGGVGRVDDGGEFFDAIGAKVGDGEGAVGVFLGGEGALLGLLDELFEFAVDLDDVLGVGVADDGGDEALILGDGQGDVDAGMLKDGLALPGGVEHGMVFEGVGGELDEVGVEGEFFVGGGVVAFAFVEEAVDGGGDAEVVVGRGEF